MKKLLLGLTAVFCCSQTALNAQAFNAAISVSGTNTSNDNAYDVEVTAFDERLIAASRVNGAGNNDGYMRVYSATNAPLFEYSIMGSGDDIVYAVDKFTTATPISDIYFTGHFTGSANVFRRVFPGAPVLITTLTAPSGLATDRTYFVMKVNTMGTFSWVCLAGNTITANEESGGDVTVEQVNGMRMVWTTGAFRGTSTFTAAPGAITRTALGTGQDVFVACYTDNGATAALNWVNTATSPVPADNDIGWCVDADANGISYVTGSVASGTATFNSTGGPAQITTAGFGDDDAFVARYSLSGLCTNTLLLGGNGIGGGIVDQGRGIVVTRTGTNVYVSGYYRGGGGSFGGATAQSEGFVQYLTAATLTPGWFRTVRSTGFDGCYRLCLNTAETFCMVSGNYENTVNVIDQFGTTLYTETPCSGTSGIDGFVLRMDAGTGASPVMGRVCGVSGIDITSGVDASNNNEAVTCGYFSSVTLTFEGSVPTLTNASALGTFDAFYAVFIPTSIVRLGQFNEAETVSGVKLYPNPASSQFIIQLDDAITEHPSQFILLDLSGRTVLTQQLTQTQTEVSVAELPAGVYLWRITEQNGAVHLDKLIIAD
ncbi:MAG: T9SS type A sorting domain-containing protein [Bacteroidota bacterium]|jgi:hypothetical protein